MSVILDALRKAQEERKRANSRPTDSDGPPPRKKMSLLYYLMGLALLLLVILFLIPNVRHPMRPGRGTDRASYSAQQPSTVPDPAVPTGSTTGPQVQRAAETPKPEGPTEKDRTSRHVFEEKRPPKVSWAPRIQVPVPARQGGMLTAMRSAPTPESPSTGMAAEQSIVVKTADVKDKATEMYNNALRQMELGRPEDARRSYLAVLADRPDDAETLNNLGVLAMTRGNIRDASSYFKIALEARADYPKAHNNLGMLYMKEGRNRSAEEHLRQALKLDPNGVEPHLNLSALLRSEGRFQEAARLLASLLQKGHKEPIVHLSYAIINDEMGNYPEAITYYGRYVSQAVQCPERTVVTDRIKVLKGYQSSGNR